MVDLEPTFRCARAARSSRRTCSSRAAYGETEVEVRADGMSPPGHRQAAGSDGQEARPLHPLRHRRAAGGGRASCASSASAPTKTGKASSRSGDDAIQFWTEGLGSLPEEWDLFVPDDLVDVQVRDEAARRQRARVERRRLALAQAHVRVATASPSRTTSSRAASPRAGATCASTDGSFARSTPQKVQAVLDRQAEILATAAGKGGKLPLSQAGRVQELLEQVGKAQRHRPTRRSSSRSSQTSTRSRPSRSRATSRRTLRPYQEQGFHVARVPPRIGSGGVLADDMGLGKTVQTIALLLAVKAREEAKRRQKPFKALIVAPTSVVTNWVREIEKFAPSLKHVALARRRSQGAQPTSSKTPTSSSRATRSCAATRSAAKLDLAYAILDEAQHIKNPMSAPRRARPSGSSAHRRLALTGTPIENRLSRDLVDLRLRLAGPARRRSTSSRSATRARSTRRPEGGRSACARRSIRSSCAAPRPRSPRICRRRSRSIRFCELTGEQATLYGAGPRRGARAGHGRGRASRASPRARSRSSPASRVCVRRRAIRASSACRATFGDEDSRQARRAPRAHRKTCDRRRPPRARLQPVRHDAARSSSNALDEDGVTLRVPRRLDQGSPGARRALPATTPAARLPHLAQGGRHRPEPHRRRHRHPLRSVVEPGRRGSGDRPRAPHRPDQGRHAYRLDRRRARSRRRSSSSAARSASSSARSSARTRAARRSSPGRPRRALRRLRPTEAPAENHSRRPKSRSDLRRTSSDLAQVPGLEQTLA